MLIHTEKLMLVPLSVRQLKLWMNDLPKLEQELRCTYDARPLVGELEEKVKEQLAITQTDSPNYMFHSYWFVIRKSDHVVVGFADFKGVPNENGEVQIAYGLDEKYDQQGYSTETIEALCHWARKQPRVRSILAVTDRTNLRSQTVLSQCGFYKERMDEKIWWRRM